MKRAAASVRRLVGLEQASAVECKRASTIPEGAWGVRKFCLSWTFSLDSCRRLASGKIASRGLRTRENGTRSGRREDETSASKLAKLWRKFFEDPKKWSDNRLSKRRKKSPDFVHKITEEALWIDSELNPPWVNARIEALAAHHPDPAASKPVQAVQPWVQTTDREVRISSERSERKAEEITSLVSFGRLTKLCQEGRVKHAVHEFNALYQSGMKIPTNLLHLLLQQCTDRKDLAGGREVYALISQCHLESNVFLGNHLIRMFSSLGCLVEANKVFSKLLAPDAFVWAAIISANAKHGQCGRAIELYFKMQESGKKPSDYVFAAVLKACASVAALKEGRLIHGHAKEIGLEANMFVGSALIDMYAKAGDLEEARKVFNKLTEKDLVSWTAMIAGYSQHGNAAEALQLFCRMEQDGMTPNKVTYLSVLQAFSGTAALKEGKLLHAKIRETGFETDVKVASSVISMYARCESLGEARKVFDNCPARDVVLWNTMISAYAQHEHGDEALQLFSRMQQLGVDPDIVTFVSILKACSGTGALDQGKVIHNIVIERGVQSDLFVGSTLIDMYSKCGRVADARTVFDGLPTKNMVSWNAMIAGYAQHGDTYHALEIFQSLQKHGMQPDEASFVSILKALSFSAALDQVKVIHALIIDSGLERNLVVGNSLVDFYARCGYLRDAHQVFDKLATRDLVSWTSLLTGYVRHGDGQQAVKLFQRMQQEGMQPDRVTFVSILKACSSIVSLDQGRMLHCHAMAHGLDADEFVGNTLIDMYAKSGSVHEAREVFDRLETKNRATWNAMINGYAQHGKGPEALHTFDQMLRAGMEPDDATFVSLLSACSRAGLLHEGDRLFKSMFEVHGLRPGMDHFACMVDLLSRAGSLQEAVDLISTMPSEPDAVVWLSLLGACRTHCNVDLGRRAFESLLKLDPRRSAAYVLMSNIYAAAGRWEDMVETREMMQKMGLQKEPGRTWMEVNNEVHNFAAEDMHHSDRKDIYASLGRLLRTINNSDPQVSYVPI